MSGMQQQKRQQQTTAAGSRSSSSGIATSGFECAQQRSSCSRISSSGIPTLPVSSVPRKGCSGLLSSHLAQEDPRDNCCALPTLTRPCGRCCSEPRVWCRAAPRCLRIFFYNSAARNSRGTAQLFF